MRFLVDSIAWQNFDIKYPNFGNEACNVYIVLTIDELNPPGNMSSSYSMWPTMSFFLMSCGYNVGSI